MRIKLTCLIIAAAMIFSGTAFAQWTMDYAADNGIAFYDVTFPSSDIGYIVGAGGVIYKSVDGGDTWVSQTSPTALSFFDVFFTSTTNGWAVGDAGLIAYTTNGTDWNLHSQSGVLTSTQDINSIEINGLNGVMGADTGLLWYTTDGGTTWTAAVSKPYVDDVNSVRMFDSLVGIAAADGDGIEYTLDGGLNWTGASINLGPAPYSRDDIEGLLVIDDTTAVATGWGSTAAGAQPMIILVTKDKGLTWTCPDETYPWAIYCYGYNFAKFPDGHVILVGGGSYSAAPIVHSSGDYSEWLPSEPFYGNTLRGVGIVPGTDRVIAVGDGGCIATSDDRGYTWSQYFKADNGFGGVLKFASYGPKVFAVGDAGLYMTKEGDGDWTFGLISTNYWAETLHDIWIVPEANPLDGYVMYVCGARDYLAKSTDKGETWTELSHALALSSAIYGMHWFDAENGLLAGEYNGDDALYTTDDGGLTRTLVWSNVKSEQINSISFAPDNLHGVFVCDNIAMYYTSNGGANWTAGTENILSTTNDLEEVHMVNPTTAWTVGDAGTFAVTTDGGAVWTQQTGLPALTLMDVYFNHDNFGWISGDDGLVYYTNNGGSSWTNANATLVPSTKDVNAVYLQGTTGKLFIGCDYNDILVRADAVSGDDDPIALPFALNQNYPNPFNPATTISFSLGKDGFVSLNVYDVAGRLVAEVLNKEMSAGDYSINFSAKGLSSGVYFYRLKTDGNEQVRKMIVLR